MKLLCVDTTGVSCSVAVQGEGKTLCEISIHQKITHSRKLMPAIDQALGFSSLTMADIDGFAVCRGPGSFTGLRIGISTIKGLCAGTGKPGCGISSLWALCAGLLPFLPRDAKDWETNESPASAFPVIIPMIDAAKGEVYISGYRLKKGGPEEVIPEQAVIAGDFAKSLKEPAIFVGSGALKYQQEIVSACRHRALFAPETSHNIRASVVGMLAHKCFADGKERSFKDILPVYIRKPDIRKPG